MEIEKEFTPYEESLELKELGFDEPCIRQWIWSPLRKTRYLSDEWLTTTGNVVKSPIKSQSFRFFREKYGYDVSIKKCRPTEYKFEITQSFVEDDYYFIDYPFPSYEEAEIECIKKLIEIVKRKVVW